MFTVTTANTEKASTNIVGQGINWVQISLGVFILLTATLVYLLDRAPEQTYFIYQTGFNLSLYDSHSGLFGSMGNNLPSFAHALAFILITAGLLATHKNTYLLICLFWFALESLFEVGQALINSTTVIPGWFAGIPFLENTENYFLNGTFDWNDVAASALGAILAYLVLRTTSKTGRKTS